MAPDAEGDQTEADAVYAEASSGNAVGEGLTLP